MRGERRRMHAFEVKDGETERVWCVVLCVCVCVCMSVCGRVCACEERDAWQLHAHMCVCAVDKQSDAVEAFSIMASKQFAFPFDEYK